MLRRMYSGQSTTMLVVDALLPEERVPRSLKIFLLALAIIDDLAAIRTILLFNKQHDLAVAELEKAVSQEPNFFVGVRDACGRVECDGET